MAKPGALILLALLGCGDDTPPSVDARPDADYSMNGIGGPCARPMDPGCTQSSGAEAQGTCADGEICLLSSCRGGFAWPDGYCSKPCGTCPLGAACVDVGNHSLIKYCLQKCTTQMDCRTAGQGIGCVATSFGDVCMGATVCEPPPATLPRGDWSANLRVAAPTISTFESEGNVVSDGQGHLAMSQTAIYFGTTRTANVIGAAIFDESGMSFHTPVAYGEYVRSSYTSDPVIAYDSEAAGSPKPLYLVWLDLDTDVNGNVSKIHTMVAKSTDGGVTFGPPDGSAASMLNTAGQEIEGVDDVFDKPWIAASNGNVYVTYSVDGGAQENMLVSANGGVSWSVGRAVHTSTGFHNFAQIAIARQTGDVFVTMSSGSMVAARWLRSMGASWFEPDVVIPNSGTFNPPANAVSADGTHLWAVWDASSSAGSNVYAAVASNARGGAALSFAQPVGVNDDTGCGKHIHSTVAVDAGGIGHVVWLDNRYSGNIIQGSVHYAKSTTPDGTAFTTPVVVSDTLFPFNDTRVPGLWLGDYIGIVATADKVYAYWADPRLGTPVQRTHFFLASRPLP